MELIGFDQRTEILHTRHAELLAEATQRRLLNRLPKPASSRPWLSRLYSRWQSILRHNWGTFHAKWQIETTPKG